ncbi:hypothetical protein [Stenotrophomonas sp. MMGLT7]|uniref:hypothetical protein n=1 Tax=Stenotrophomonas sp. MMGLT7 TaxID=2901227 RepID=UPI001E613291|nr:hypothetical protein [Stenotrophomonas sp. MMGLT7]MCD7099402.1 hypothetical protein [Stenotrophomonas sp. MMGLT7]
MFLYSRVAILTFGLCTATSCAATSPGEDSLQARCIATPIDDHIELRIVDGKQVSACPPDAEEGCPYNANIGQTYLDDTPDFNHDGRKDAIISYLGSSYGGIDVVDKLVLAQCADGTYIRLLEGSFTTLVAPEPPYANWPELIATLNCPASKSQDTLTKQFKLYFDPKIFQYQIPPQQSLRDACKDI